MSYGPNNWLQHQDYNTSQDTVSLVSWRWLFQSLTHVINSAAATRDDGRENGLSVCSQQ